MTIKLNKLLVLITFVSMCSVQIFAMEENEEVEEFSISQFSLYEIVVYETRDLDVLRVLQCVNRDFRNFLPKAYYLPFMGQMNEEAFQVEEERDSQIDEEDLQLHEEDLQLHEEDLQLHEEDLQLYEEDLQVYTESFQAYGDQFCEEGKMVGYDFSQVLTWASEDSNFRGERVRGALYGFLTGSAEGNVEVFSEAFAELLACKAFYPFPCWMDQVMLSTVHDVRTYDLRLSIDQKIQLQPNFHLNFCDFEVGLDFFKILKKSKKKKFKVFNFFKKTKSVRISDPWLLGFVLDEALSVWDISLQDIMDFAEREHESAFLGFLCGYYYKQGLVEGSKSQIFDYSNLINGGSVSDEQSKKKKRVLENLNCYISMKVVNFLGNGGF